jgi:transposase
VTRAKQLRLLEAQLEEYRKQIEKLFAQHPDHNLFGSLPGAGPKLAPRLLAEMGDDRDRFESAQALQGYAGTAPVSYQSGPVHRVQVRWHCNKILRHSVYLWANLTRHDCPWAETYYQSLRKRGKTHACALRCLSPALAENPLENVADPNRVRCGVASEKPAPARVLGAQTAERL